jgi:uncharacterized protein (TIGR03382 family)
LNTALLLALLALSPARADSFSFAVVGDTQGSGGGLNFDVMPQMVQDMNALEPSMVFFVGDLINGHYTIDPHQASWEAWVAEAWQLDSEIYALPGNHDFFPGVSVYDAWLETFDWLPTHNSPAGQEGMTYHVDYGDSRFISVLTDSEWGQVTPDQAWLDAVLADPDTQAADHVFVFSHHPVSFSTVEPLGNTSDAFWQSLLGAGADAYFCGHWHRYQPSQLGGGGDTWETIIGTGGGPEYAPWRAYQQVKGFLLVEVDDALVTASFYGDDDDDGQYDDVLDSYVITWDGEPSRGLVGRWSFDDGGLEDDAPAPLGKAVHGVSLGGAEAAEDAERGGVLELAGGLGEGVAAGAIGDYVLSVNGDLTLSAFARAQHPGSGDWGQVLLCYGTADYYSEDEETNYSWWLSLTQGDHLLAYWEYEDGVNVTVRSTAPVPDPSGWHHYALVRDAEAMELSFLVDGVLLGEALPFERLPTGGGRGMAYLGRDVAGSDGYELAGALDEVCVFDRALSPGELEALAAGFDCVFDADGDGVGGWEGDCDDADASAYPGAEEICDDAVDNDCDGEIDEDDCPEDSGEPDPDTGEASDSDEPGVDDPESSGPCGCAGQPTPGSALALLLPMVGLLARRRRGGLEP